MISPTDAARVLKRHITLPDVQAAVHHGINSAANKLENQPFAPYAIPIAQAIWFGLVVFREGGHGGLLRHVLLQEAVQTLMGPVKKALPMVASNLKHKVEGLLVPIFKKLS